MNPRVDARSRTIAVASGKGGVGKSTTALNIAVFFAKRHLRVGLFDIDPLSNIATILDIDRNRLDVVRENVQVDDSLADHRLRVAPNIDLVFPRPKLRRGDSVALLTKLFDTWDAELARRYDILLLDMPAGIGNEENLAFLPYVGHLVVVTNPEPTAHVSSGGYIKAALEIVPDIRILLWHNRHTVLTEPGFQPLDVVGTYNRYVPEELAIDLASVRSIKDIARVPVDPALSLLEAETTIQGAAIARIRETLEMIYKALVAEAGHLPGIPDPVANLIRWYLGSHRNLQTVDGTVSDIDRYLLGLVQGAKDGDTFFTDPQRAAVEAVIADLTAGGLRRSVAQAITTIDQAAGRSSSRIGAIARDTLNVCLQAKNRSESLFLRNLVGLLLFYFAIFRLCEARSVQQLLRRFVPYRKDASGKRIRDRRRQIAAILKRDDEYHRRYFLMIKSLFPIVVRQLVAITKRSKLNAFVLRDRSGRVHQNAYLRLLADFLHDAVNGGLGLFVALKFNQAGAALQKGAEALLSEVKTVNAARRQDSR